LFDGNILDVEAMKSRSRASTKFLSVNKESSGTISDARALKNY